MPWRGNMKPLMGQLPMEACSLGVVVSRNGAEEP